VSSEKKVPGRPRVYDSSSAKVEAFRKRRQSAGLVRKEYLISKEVAALIQSMAELYRVSAIDIGSALLHYAVKQYQATAAPHDGAQPLSAPPPLDHALQEYMERKKGNST
jgi:hypothetical protein